MAEDRAAIQAASESNAEPAPAYISPPEMKPYATLAIEAATEAIYQATVPVHRMRNSRIWREMARLEARETAVLIVAAVAPLVRRAALEEAEEKASLPKLAAEDVKFLTSNSDRYTFAAGYNEGIERVSAAVRALVGQEGNPQVE